MSRSRIKRSRRNRSAFSTEFLPENLLGLGLPDDLPEDELNKLFGTAEERFFWKHFSSKRPVLYHYTRQESFISIVQNRTFWVSSVRHFSDFSEVEYAYELLASLILPLRSTAIYGLESGFLELLSQEAQPARHSDNYVLCFSTKFDDLNQWRSYASPGLGYCVGFRTESLTAVAQKYNARLGRCLYSRQDQEALVKALLEYALRDLSSYFPYYGPGEINEGLAQARSKVFAEQFSAIAPLFKNPAFSEEAEVRLIFDAASNALPIRFRSAATSIVPYVEIGFATTDIEELSPETVIVKTCSRPEFVSDAAKKFLMNSGYEKVPISASNIPFREGL